MDVYRDGATKEVLEKLFMAADERAVAAEKAAAERVAEAERVAAKKVEEVMSAPHSHPLALGIIIGWAQGASKGVYQLQGEWWSPSLRPGC